MYNTFDYEPPERGVQARVMATLHMDGFKLRIVGGRTVYDNLVIGRNGGYYLVKGDRYRLIPDWTVLEVVSGE